MPEQPECNNYCGFYARPNCLYNLMMGLGNKELEPLPPNRKCVHPEAHEPPESRLSDKVECIGSPVSSRE